METDSVLRQRNCASVCGGSSLIHECTSRFFHSTCTCKETIFRGNGYLNINRIALFIPRGNTKVC